MSFKFNWGSFNDSFYSHISQLIEKGLNSGPPPHGICSQLVIKDLYFGQEPPEVSILEIAELSMHRARILARISYASDGYIVINTHVQANPLCGTRGASYEDWMSSVKMDTPPQPILAADKSLVVPMVIRITDLHVDGIIWLCWTDQSPHFSLAFVSDPLVNVSVSSSFDCMAKVKQSLQEEIEQEIRKALLKTIPEAARSYR